MAAADSPLDNDDFLLALHLEGIVDQRARFVLLHFLDDLGDESGRLSVRSRLCIADDMQNSPHRTSPAWGKAPR